MAFSYTVTEEDATASKRVKRGTYANAGGSAGGTINTGLVRVEHMTFTPLAAAVGNAPVINGTLPCAGNAVVIVTDADQSGIWEAAGR